MNRFVKTAVLSAALAATTMATLPAHADDWRWRHHRHGGDAVAAGIVGLAAGALIGGALASQPPPPRDYYYDDYGEPAYVVRRRPIVVRRAPVVTYRGGIEPWTRNWYEYCSDRYRSFDARTGTFTGYDGEQHFCVAN
ncbi:MAG: BA14K family protein [Mesorhizobium sp.]|nr:BA14K family protein [Mesorhizobium sp.]MBN9243586.1 BA14K family protein [Mesorhizobium sp.]